jgi:hypothetical protein
MLNTSAIQSISLQQFNPSAIQYADLDLLPD